MSVPSQPSTPGQSDTATMAGGSIASMEADINAMSITQQQPVTNLPSSLTPAPVTVVRTPNPTHIPSPQPAATYEAPSQNVMHQPPTQQQGLASGLTQYQQQAARIPSGMQQDASRFPVQQQVSLALGDQPPAPQSTPVTSLPGAQQLQQELASLPSSTYSQHLTSSAPPIMKESSPQMFISTTAGVVSGLPVAPPTFSLPSVPPTISLGPTPALSSSVTAQ